MNTLSSTFSFFAQFLFSNLEKIVMDVKKTQIFTLFLSFLPLVLIVFNLVLHLSLTLRFASLNYDEFVLLAMSRQPADELYNTLQVEPHPVGFYLFLRFMHTIDLTPAQIRILLTIIFHLILFIATAFAYRTKLIERYSLKLGFALVFSSFSLFEIGYQIKQDIISFPVFVLFFVCLLHLLDTPKKKYLFISSAIFISSGILLTLFSYIYFFFSITTLICSLGFQIYKKRKHSSLILIIQLGLMMTVAIAYYTVFGHYQIENNYLNTNRFLWTKDIENSFLHRLPEMSIGIQSPPLNDMICFFFLVLFVQAIREELRHKDEKKIFLFFLFLLYLCITYVLRLFVQNRYALPVFLPFFILTTFPQQKYFRILIFGTILFLFYARTATLLISVIDNTLAFHKLDSTIESIASEEKTGLMSNVPGVPLYIKLRFLKEKASLYPVSTSKHTDIIPRYSFDKQHFSESSEILEKDINEITQDLRSLGLKKYIYIESHGVAYTYYDPEKKIEKALNNYCTHYSLVERFSDIDIYLFSNCE